jgi:hypothetical protein
MSELSIEDSLGFCVVKVARWQELEQWNELRFAVS